MEIKLLSGALGAEIMGINLKDTSEENIKKIQSKTNTEEVNDIINFILQKSRRGICTPKI